MKKLSILMVGIVGFMVIGSSYGAPSYLTRVGTNGYKVTYDYTDKAKLGWYVGAHADLNFMSWTNKYNSDYPGINSDYDSDKYLLEPVFGGNISGGFRFKYFWRAELEAGYISQYTDKDNAVEFNLTVPYLMLNGYYDFTNNVYVGAGIGAAIPIKQIDYENFIGGERTKTSVSPMLGIMLGYSKPLDQNLVLDIRYRLSGFYGGSQTRHFEYDTEDAPGVWQEAYVENKIGLVLDNSISIGLRYEF